VFLNYFLKIPIHDAFRVTKVRCDNIFALIISGRGKALELALQISEFQMVNSQGKMEPRRRKGREGFFVFFLIGERSIRKKKRFIGGGYPKWL